MAVQPLSSTTTLTSHDRFDMSMADIPVRMDRPQLGDCPLRSLPPGYRLRDWRDGDAVLWLSLWRACETLQVLADDLFQREFHDQQHEIARRLIFVEDPSGALVSTCAAWYDDESGVAELGRIHWVAVHPAHQGRGLSGVLLSAALDRLAALGHRRAFLNTSTARPAALGLYLDFWFRPTPRTIAEHLAWQQVPATLRPAQAAQLTRHLQQFPH